MRESQVSGLVEDGGQIGLLDQLPGGMIGGRNDDVSTAQDSSFASGYNHIEDVAQQGAPPVDRKQLPPTEPPALAGSEDKR